jgi:hypothetical protein
MISVGDDSGNVTLCAPEPCRTVHVGDMDALAEAVVTIPGEISGFREDSMPTMLDGTAARREAPSSPHGFLHGPQVNISVYAMFGQRPVVLRFPFIYGHPEVPSNAQTRIIDSFQLS